LARAAQAAQLERRPEVIAALDRERAKVLYAAAERKYILSKIQISPEQVRQRFEERRSNFSTPEMIRVRHIYKRVRPEDGPEHRAAIRSELEALRQQVLDGARFAELAKRHSESSSAKFGGILQSSARGSMDEDFERAAWALQEDEISPVVETRQGYHLIQMDQRIAPYTYRLEEVRERIRRRLIVEQTERLTGEFVTQATQNLGAEILLAQQPLAADFSSPALRHQDRVLTLQELWSRWAPNPEASADTLSTNPVAWAADAVRKELLYLQAEADGLASQSPEIAAQIMIGRNQVLALAQLEAEGRKIEAGFSQQQVRELYARDRDQLQSPLLLSVRGIWIPFRDGVARIDVRDQAERMAADWRGGATLEELAAAEPQSSSFAWNQINVRELRQRSTPELAGAITEMSVGQVEAVLIQQYDRQRMRPEAIGYTVVRLETREEPRPLRLEEVESRLRSLLAAAQGEVSRNRVRERYLKAAGFRILESNL
ncbi:MAG TPA: peptidylprolyl isomerase, partial [Acidobacteriota bacterium]